MEEDLDGKMGFDVASRMAHSITQDKDLCGTKYLIVINIFNIFFTRVYNQY